MTCPLCGQIVVLKAAKAGMYQPTCPRCRAVFALVVEESGAWRVSRLGEEGLEGKAVASSPAPLVMAPVPAVSQVAGQAAGASGVGSGGVAGGAAGVAATAGTPSNPSGQGRPATVLNLAVGRAAQLQAAAGTAGAASEESLKAAVADAAGAYGAAGLARWRMPMAAGGWLVALMLCALLWLGGVWGLGFAALLSPVVAVLAREVTVGVVGGAGSRRSEIIERAKGLAATGGWRAVLLGLKMLVVAALAVALIVVLGWSGEFLFLGIVAAGAGVGWVYGLDLPLAQARQIAAMRLDAAVATLKARVGEQATQLAVVNAGGRDWEEVFERLFGYDAKMEMRDALRANGQLSGRRKFGAWRDGILAMLARAETPALTDATLESGGARAAETGPVVGGTTTGVGGGTGAVRAAVSQAAAVPVAQRPAAGAGPSQAPAPWPPPMPAGLGAMGVAGEEPEDEDGISRSDLRKIRRNRSYLTRRYGGVTGLLLGSQARLLLGILLFAGFVLWVRQNEIVKVDEVAAAARQVGSRGGDMLVTPADRATTGPVAVPKIYGGRAPLVVKGVPAGVSGLWRGWGAGLAAGALLLSAFYASVRLGMFVVPGAVLVWLGFLVPAGGAVGGAGVAQWVGGALVLMGFVMARKE